MKENISPEEKLLRLIRKEKKKDIVSDKKPESSPEDLKPTAKYRISLPIKKYMSFAYFRKIIWVFFSGSCIYLIISIIYPWLGFNKIRLPVSTIEKPKASQIELKREIKPYEFYLEGIKNRQIFSGTAVQEPAKPVSGISTDLMKDISLVGIISGENPQAVIEDKKAQKTYYLNKGQFIGEMQVEDIAEGKIIINYRGQRFELYL